jgi:hypothetical protein
MIISWCRYYEFEGWKFEWSRTKPFGPWPVKNDLEPRARCGKKFYEMFARFSGLSIEEQEQHRINFLTNGEA